MSLPGFSGQTPPVCSSRTPTGVTADVRAGGSGTLTASEPGRAGGARDSWDPPGGGVASHPRAESKQHK